MMSATRTQLRMVLVEAVLDVGVVIVVDLGVQIDKEAHGEPNVVQDQAISS